MAINEKLYKIASSAILPGSWDLIYIIKYMIDNDITIDELSIIEKIITRPIPPSIYEKGGRLEKNQYLELADKINKKTS